MTKSLQGTPRHCPDPKCLHSKEPFDQGFHAVSRRAGLSADAKLVHAYLVSLYRSGRDATQREIAADLGTTRHRVWSAIHELVEQNIVKSIRYGLGRPNGYVLLTLAPTDLDASHAPEIKVRTVRTRIPDSPDTSRAGTSYPKKPTKKGKYTAVHDGRCSGCGGNHEVTACPTWAGAIRT